LVEIIILHYYRRLDRNRFPLYMIATLTSFLLFSRKYRVSSNYL
jgi:hypothetical protein